MRDRDLSFLKTFGVLSLVTSLSNIFGWFGGLNFVCKGQQCSESATRINWLDIHNLTTPNGWSEAFPTIGVPDIAAISCSLAVVIIAFREYITTLLYGRVDGQISEPSSKYDNENLEVEEVKETIVEQIILSFDELMKKYTVKDLKEILLTKDLKVSGKKADLVNRAMENGCFDPPASEEPEPEIIESKSENVGVLTVEEPANESLKDLALHAIRSQKMDVDSVFEKYDENTDGRIVHSEYVAAHKDEVEKGGISAFIDRLLDDSTELRGQRLWVMFALSILLVAAMNAYAMVREPELVKIEDLVDHNNEVVSVEGIVLSWVADPYSSGEDRVNIIIEDDTGVAQLRWYRYGDIPMIGTNVVATGDVIEYNGRIWLQALGGGAISWDESDVPDAPTIAISTIAENPEDFIGDSFTITGYISKTVNPNSTFTSLDLRDHPVYGSHEHQMNMIIHSAPGQWLESGQKVEVTAVIEYSQKFLQWTLHTEGPEVRIVRTHEPTSTEIGWSNYQTWSYNKEGLVALKGVISGDEIVEPEGSLKACLLNQGNISEYQGSEVTFHGRLIWSTSYSGWCIDSSNSGHVELLDVSDAENILGQLASNPDSTLEEIDNSTTFLITGVVSGATLMSESGDTKIIIADAVYPNTLAKMDAYIPVGQHFGWLEEGQPIVVNATVSWNSASSEFQLMVLDMVLTGEPSSANPYDLGDGAPAFYDLNKITSITGNLVVLDGQTYLQKEGGIEKIQINVKSNSVYESNSQNEGKTLKWTGRLIEVADDVTLAHHYVLDNADVTDENGNGIADDAEDF
ncbi:MAG: hypothetical protein CMA11_01785 [Euryarchaeota archaeon]|nr:hypothetical protein [Euryarchaeota archaeon]